MPPRLPFRRLRCLAIGAALCLLPFGLTACGVKPNFPKAPDAASNHASAKSQRVYPKPAADTPPPGGTAAPTPAPSKP
jgi:hypothetical protein